MMPVLPVTRVRHVDEVEHGVVRDDDLLLDAVDLLLDQQQGRLRDRLLAQLLEL